MCYVKYKLCKIYFQKYVQCDRNMYSIADMSAQIVYMQYLNFYQYVTCHNSIINDISALYIVQRSMLYSVMKYANHFVLIFCGL